MLHIQLPVSMRVIYILYIFLYSVTVFGVHVFWMVARKKKSIRKPKAEIYCNLAANGMEVDIWLNNGLCEKKKRIRTKLMVTLLKIHCECRWMIFFGLFFIFTSLDSLWNLIIYYSNWLNSVWLTQRFIFISLFCVRLFNLFSLVSFLILFFLDILFMFVFDSFDIGLVDGFNHISDAKRFHNVITDAFFL